MNPEGELTPEQEENLKTWSDQRDSILSEISILKLEKEKLQNTNKDLAISGTSMNDSANEVRGRIAELKVSESALALSISKNIASLQYKKTTLESEVTSLTRIIEILTSQKTSLESDVVLALSTYDTVRSETFSLDKIVDHVTTVSNNNTNKINSLVDNLVASLNDIIEVNKKNVYETNIVIEKLPAMLLEMQRRGLIKNKI